MHSFCITRVFCDAGQILEIAGLLQPRRGIHPETLGSMPLTKVEREARRRVLLTYLNVTERKARLEQSDGHLDKFQKLAAQIVLAQMKCSEEEILRIFSLVADIEQSAMQASIAIETWNSQRVPCRVHVAVVAQLTLPLAP